MPVTIRCETCGKEFGVWPGLVGIRRHCSHTCRGAPVMLACEQCGKKFRVTQSRNMRKGHKHCSHECAYAAQKDRWIERFWKNVDKSAGPDGCWIWKGGLSSNGYGQCRAVGRNRLAHRVSYEIVNGPIPDKLQVNHSCDIRACLQPKHLWLGTQADNIKDAMHKGRMATGEKNFLRRCPERRLYGEDNPSRKHPEKLARGERCPSARLKEEQIPEIRMARANGETYQEIAIRYGVSISAICGVLKGLTWKHVK
jgi:hypothetical protein